MPQTKYYLQQPATIDGKDFSKGEVIATIDTPEGVDVNRAISAIRTGQAIPNKPEDAESGTKEGPPATAKSAKGPRTSHE